MKGFLKEAEDLYFNWITAFLKYATRYAHTSISPDLLRSGDVAKSKTYVTPQYFSVSRCCLSLSVVTLCR